MSRQLTLISTFIILAAVSWWLVEPPSEEAVAVQSTVEAEADFYSEGLVLTTMDETGRPKRRLTAEKWEHFDDGRSELFVQQLQLFSNNRMPLRIESPRATLSADESEWFLYPDVTLNREAGMGKRALHVETMNLHIWPEKEYAETEEAVRLESRKDWLTAVGLQAWFADESTRFKLQTEVRGRYALD